MAQRKTNCPSLIQSILMILILMFLLSSIHLLVPVPKVNIVAILVLATIQIHMQNADILDKMIVHLVRSSKITYL